MSYNLQPLITILEQILNPEETRWIVIDYNKPQLESLLQKAAALNQILENSSVPIPESLASGIRDAAHQAEDIIERATVNRMLSKRRPMTFSFSIHGLREVMEELQSAMEQVVEIVEGNTKKLMSTDSSSSAAAFLPSSKNVAVVGVDEDLLLLKDRLTGYERKLEIIPIVGMGGIGKTTIARHLYEDPLILSHFDVCAWTTISQDINVQAVLLGLLSRPDGKPSDELTESTDSELKEILYKRLYGRRYFIVLDDMWSTDSWDVIRSCFPPNNNGSRIVLTTRESEVAENVGTQSCQHRVQLLQESESWKLLCQIVFGGDDDCPDIAALEGIGKKIAGDCGGLPLAIKAIGGLLSKAERSRDIWESIGNDISVAKANDDGLLNVLSLSYNHLPNHLKPCFLYMGAFPEDYVIKGSRLVHMWMAEGFLKTNGGKSLEEEAEAEDYLRSLVERNLILVTRKKTNAKAMSYGMHDLLRDLCRRKASDENFVHVQNKRAEVELHKVRRVSVHTSYRIEDVDMMSLARSCICIARFKAPEILSPAFLVLKLLRVLDVLGIKFEKFPVEILQLVNLRFFAFSCDCKTDIPKEISRLLNLQTLIGKIKWGRVPSEIWEMSELRYLKLDALISIQEGCMKQDMLQTIFWVMSNPYINKMGFFKTIPNIKKLAICWVELPSSSEEVVDMSNLHKLQTLRFHSSVLPDGCRYQPTLRYPPNIRKLTLLKFVIFPRVLKTLCALPNLEVLKLAKCEFENGVFEATEEGEDVFRSLQCLALQELNNLVIWRAEETNFPTLRNLAILDCHLLEQIPSSIGDISTLQLIDVFRCNSSVEASAKEILKVQQEDFDNYQLRLLIDNKVVE